MKFIQMVWHLSIICDQTRAPFDSAQNVMNSVAGTRLPRDFSTTCHGAVEAPGCKAIQTPAALSFALLEKAQA